MIPFRCLYRTCTGHVDPCVHLQVGVNMRFQKILGGVNYTRGNALVLPGKLKSALGYGDRQDSSICPNLAFAPLNGIKFCHKTVANTMGASVTWFCFKVVYLAHPVVKVNLLDNNIVIFCLAAIGKI